MIRLVRQPEGSSLCGQACVAMVAGVTLIEATAAIGHTRPTYTRDLVAALRSFGVQCEDRLKLVSRARPELPARAILSIRKFVEKPNGGRKRYGHWMVIWYGHIFDPEGVWPEHYRDGWRVTSYLEIGG